MSADYILLWLDIDFQWQPWFHIVEALKSKHDMISSTTMPKIYLHTLGSWNHWTLNTTDVRYIC